jgi:hypothetical protein
VYLHDYKGKKPYMGVRITPTLKKLIAVRPANRYSPPVLLRELELPKWAPNIGSLMKLEIPDRRFGSYIFDCDGTLADTMPLHYRAWNRIIEEHGAPFSEELFYELGGKPTEKILVLLRDEHGRDFGWRRSARSADRARRRSRKSVMGRLVAVRIGRWSGAAGGGALGLAGRPYTPVD